jgi:fucose permease
MRNISIVLPVLIREMKISYSEAGFLVSAFFVTYALAQIPSGWLADRLGGLKTLVAGTL